MVIFFVESRDCSNFPYKEFKSFSPAEKYAEKLSLKFPDCEFFVNVVIPDARFIDGERL